ncbi:unnamed protein product [Pleuronectes platessa]|uniref:Uncharacterized protein n=1 Tax=Pleuronectes platessa TaxID=8262 RepID=A0A9N7VN42_PLEPL|nr:unnamed protein product [Pleuronectes platessa]
MHIWSRVEALPRLGGSFTSQRLSVQHREVLIRWRLTASLVRGLSFSWTAGRCPSPARKAGRWRGPGTAVSGGHSGRVSGPSRGSPQLRRPLGEPSVRAGGHPAVRLGWRLAAD